MILGSALVLISCAGGVHAANFQLRLLSDAPSGGASCNDGSPPGYYYDLVDGSTKWMLFLNGGFCCHDEASCAARWHDSPDLMSSKGWAQSQDLEGVFSDDVNKSPHFAKSNRISVGYCSSDSWSGTRDNSSETFGWKFQGHHIVQAVIKDLIQNYGMAEADEVVFGGCSAGGRGSIYNLDTVCGMVAAAKAGTSKQAKCRGMHDAAYWVDIAEFPASTSTPLSITIQEGMHFWNSFLLQGDCAKTVGEAAAWQCFFGEGVTKYTKTPFLIHIEQYDAFQSTTDVGHGPPFSNDEMTYLGELRGALHSGIATNVGDPNRAFSCACYSHCLADKDTFFYTTLTQPLYPHTATTFHDAVVGFLEQGDLTPVIDTCSGFNCTHTCDDVQW
eukprot:CAMPEP_0113873336 /NCGR_PEP_ID=MMETSP0780_2-20120614/3712_1 /TAXON_ID=652834 /ORGANISM="Palpitomonas bilix" /LENGTH=386 /DNA_ID=CAMNT_0000858967 /DNA_START=62 /DNA_END=1222 /DNA_ORIENTATION=- /assembly_acc=CAM_ASM_000599